MREIQIPAIWLVCLFAFLCLCLYFALSFHCSFFMLLPRSERPSLLAHRFLANPYAYCIKIFIDKKISKKESGGRQQTPPPPDEVV